MVKTKIIPIVVKVFRVQLVLLGIPEQSEHLIPVQSEQFIPEQTVQFILV